MGGIFIFTACLCAVIATSVGCPLYYSYKKRELEFKRKQMEEEHRTNNLAIAYQMMGARPELTLPEIKQLMDNNMDANGIMMK